MSELISSLFGSFSQNPIKPFTKIAHLPSSLHLLYLTYLFKLGISENSLLLVCKSNRELALYKDFFLSHRVPCFSLPSYDVMPYEEANITPLILEERVQSFYNIMEKQRAIYLIPVKSLLFPSIPFLELKKQLLSYRVNQEVNRQDLLEKLVSMGYHRLPFIQWKGSFSLRGEILDIYPFHYEHPVRIYFFDKMIEKISFFALDGETIIENKNLNEILISPIYDFIFDAPKKETLLKDLEKEFGPEKLNSFASIDENQHNIHLAPFFYKNHHVLQFFKSAHHPFSLVINSLASCLSDEKNVQREIKELYFNSFNAHKIMVHPDQYALDFQTIIKDSPSTIRIEALGEDNADIDFSSLFGACPEYKGRLEIFEAQVAKEFPDYKVVLCAQNPQHAKQLGDLFESYEIQIVEFLDNGVIDKQNKVLYVTRTDLFGKKITKLKHEKLLKQSQAIDSFSDLERGDPVVHIQHGIGIYEGIQKIAVLGTQKDYIKITYADEEVLYIPVEQIFLVHKYLGAPNPTLHNLGGKKWEQKKERVRKQLEDMSDELALLYETRQQIKGYAFPKDVPFQQAFEASFPYEETEGQLQAIDDVKRDMESIFVMDRLICGDVGYGKTEVALRAIFKAISNGKQVAFLAPTTLLADQHYRGMLKRFENFTVQIRMLSRLVGASFQKKTLEQLKEGNIDIVVGTHSLLAEKVVFKDLGLLVVDEEQRFGVKHKERIKVMKNNVDVLTLSATPIPRTLYMGLSQIRDMSLITTPPMNRLAIKTHVMAFNENIMKLAIERELERNGQIFIIHNRVKTITAFYDFVKQLCPQAKVIVGHAQMPPAQVEDIFLGFINHEYDILISTTIIESGIDISNANTIIIDKPELLGLSELYQLRGRVGRGDRQAYAYLFYNAAQGLTPTMEKRLEALEEHTELGSGFQIAMRDLEIRGAGNLLGKDQSGLFEDIGMELYTKMLQDVTDQVKGIIKDQTEPLIDIPFNGYIPEEYIPNENERFYIYKMLMRSNSFEDLETLLNEMQERYGQVPSSINNLIVIVKITVLAKKLKVLELKYNSKKEFVIYFNQKPSFNPESFAKYMQKGTIAILSTTAFKVHIEHETIPPLEELLTLLKEITVP